jgi:hypothetical protein
MLPLMTLEALLFYPLDKLLSFLYIKDVGSERFTSSKNLAYALTDIGFRV